MAIKSVVNHPCGFGLESVINRKPFGYFDQIMDEVFREASYYQRTGSYPPGSRVRIFGKPVVVVRGREAMFDRYSVDLIGGLMCVERIIERLKLIRAELAVYSSLRCAG